MGDEASQASSDLVVPTRFRGPTSSGNGGWSAGAMAHLLDPAHGSAVTVTLRRPPPLETPMEVAADGAGLVASHDGETVLEAQPAATEPSGSTRVARRGRAAEAAYPGWSATRSRSASPAAPAASPATASGSSPVTCPTRATWRARPPPGPPRVAARGLARVRRRERRASLAVDLGGPRLRRGWSVDMIERAIVLGRMTGRVASCRPSARSTSWSASRAGSTVASSTRRPRSTTASGALVGIADHVWIAIDPAMFS